MSSDQPSANVWYHPTSGRITGALLVAASLLVVVLAVVDPDNVSVAVGFGALATGALGWALLLRPRVGVEGPALVLRNPFITHRVPLAAIEELAVRQVLALRAGDRRYTCPGLGRTRKSLVTRQAPADPVAAIETASYGEYAEGQLFARMEKARDDAGVRPRSDEQLALAGQIRSSWAWPELVVLGIGIVGCVLAAVL